MNTRKVLSYASIAAKAGHVRSGAVQTGESLRPGKAFLLLISEDCSENRKKELLAAAGNAGIPYRQIPADKETLGKSIGKPERSAIVITDGRLASAMIAAADEKNATAGMPASE